MKVNIQEQITQAWSRKLSPEEVAEGIKFARAQKVADEQGAPRVYPTIKCPECDYDIYPEWQGNGVGYECHGRKDCPHCKQEMDCDWEETVLRCFSGYEGVVKDKVKCRRAGAIACLEQALCRQWTPWVRALTSAA